MSPFIQSKYFINNKFFLSLNQTFCFLSLFPQSKRTFESFFKKKIFFSYLETFKKRHKIFFFFAAFCNAKIKMFYFFSLLVWSCLKNHKYKSSKLSIYMVNFLCNLMTKKIQRTSNVYLKYYFFFIQNFCLGLAESKGNEKTVSCDVSNISFNIL